MKCGRSAPESPEWVGGSMCDGPNRGRMCRGYPACRSCPREAQRPCMSVSGCARDQRLTLPPCGVQPLAQGGEAAEAAMHGHCTREPFPWHSAAGCVSAGYPEGGAFSYLPWSWLFHRLTSQANWWSLMRFLLFFSLGVCCSEFGGDCLLGSSGPCCS